MEGYIGGIALPTNVTLGKCMSRKGPKVGQGMLDFVEDLRYDRIGRVVTCIPSMLCVVNVNMNMEQ